MNPLGIAFLKNTLKHYDWGSPQGLSDFTHQHPSGRREAELWMGAHPLGASKVLLGHDEVPLTELIRHNPENLLGASIVRKFGGHLPFLFKVLSVSEPLSLQAHPNASQAKAGFEHENNHQITMDSPFRNFKDPYSKPEIICALTPFSAMKGFRSPSKILSLTSPLRSPGLNQISETLKQDSAGGAIQAFFSALVTLEKSAKEALLSEVLAKIRTASLSDSAYDWVIRLNEKYPGDIGILSPLFLNVIELMPGQALFLESRELHCYLNGFGIELMGNSDNVLRGGLTNKHVDVKGLLRILKFSASNSEILEPESISESESVFRCPTEEFELGRISIEHSAYNQTAPGSVQIMLCVEGSGVMETQNQHIAFKRGDSWLVPASLGALKISGSACIYKASVPQIS